MGKKEETKEISGWKIVIYLLGFILLIAATILLINIFTVLWEINNDFYEEVILKGNTAENACLNKSGVYDFSGGMSAEHKCYINNTRHDIYYHNETWRVANN
jgi:hypothetical protein